MVDAYKIYKGEKFYLQSSGRYYQSGLKKGERLLHRRVWIEHNGPIPEDHQIHHINHDWADNRIENLELVERSAHQSHHMKKRMECPDYKEKNRRHLENIREKASEWHSSPEGLAWHSENGKEAWRNREPEKTNCQSCGKEYESYFKSRSRFCSRSCQQKENYKKHKITGECVLCGAEYTYNKYKKQECCSRACANKLRGMRERGVL